jgi:anaerobic selenocysteine-containing dehydrogenase
MKEVKSLCPYCGVGCGILVKSDGKTIRSVRGDSDHPANFGRLCAKGSTVAQTVDVRTRARWAMLRQTKSENLLAVPPSRAIRHAAEKLEGILQKYGPQAIAFYLSGQLTTESQYIFNKLAKGILRTNHVDSNSRLCMSSAASGMALSLGSDGPPTCYEDLDKADTFFFIGSNAADCHPVAFARVQRRIERARAECIVVDPRRTATAECATLHLPIKPGTDLALLNGLLHLLHADGQLDDAFIANNTEGWAGVEQMLADYPPAKVAELCGIRKYDLCHAARIIGNSKALVTCWTMGVNQSVQGTFTNNAIINLHLALGQIGRPGCGPFSLTGQPNAMGGRDVGYMAHLLPGQRQIANAEHRKWMERFWGIAPGTIHPHAGYDAIAMFDALDRGEIKAVWIAGTNPAASMPNLPRVRAALAKAELVIVQDAYTGTETNAFADVLLPAAVNLEQSGTFCNSERRVSLMEKAVEPPGDAKPDWWWARQVACAMGFSQGMRYESAEEIFDEFARSTAGRPNDQTGLTHNLLRARGPQQWPYAALNGRGTARRYVDGQFPTPSGRARFFARPYLPQGDAPNGKFPLLMTTGRVAGQWHTRTKTGHVAKLNALDPAPFLQMHPDDAAALGLHDGERVRISSRQGRAWSILRVDDAVPVGTVFMPMHWGDAWSLFASPNEAMTDDCDPISREPALKLCAVSVRRYGDGDDETDPVATHVAPPAARDLQLR